MDQTRLGLYRKLETHDVSNGLRFDRFIEQTSRFGTLLFLHEARGCNEQSVQYAEEREEEKSSLEWRRFEAFRKRESIKTTSRWVLPLLRGESLRIDV